MLVADIEIKVEKEYIFRMMKMKKESPNFQLYNHEFEEMLKVAKKKVKIKGYYKIKEMDDHYKKQGLTNCRNMILCLVTLGKDIDHTIDQLFRENEYFKAMLLNTITDQILFNATYQLYNKIKEELKTLENNRQLNLTSRFEPGSGDVSITYQKKIIDELKEDYEMNIDITEGYMYNPLKTVAYFYGADDHIANDNKDHDCRKCENMNCEYRKYDIKIIENHKEKLLQVLSGENLLNVLRDNQIEIEADCGGNKACAKCKIQLVEGELELTEGEKKLLSDEEQKNNVRLACFHTMNDNLVVKTIDSKREFEVLDKFTNIKLEQQRYHIKSIEELGESISKTLTEEINDKLNFKYKYTHKSLKQISNIKNLQQKTYYLICDDRVLEASTDNNFKSYGLAVDIGTTTIAILLVDILTGQIVDRVRLLNPQRQYGSDVISRINYVNQKDKNKLTELIVNQLEKSFLELINKNKIDKQDLREIVIAGNTTMLYLLQGFNPQKLALSPFTTVDLSLTKYRYDEIFHDNKIKCTVSLLPGMSAFVGADIASGIYHIECYKNKEISVLVDVGTNGEMVAKKGDKIYCAATAAGPAFEGASIICGTGSIAGAVSNVEILDKEVKYKTIGDLTPIGICGSGLVDIVAEGLKKGLIDYTGRLQNNIEEITIYEEDKNKIALYQKDIRELQLAKSAIAAGIQVLIDEIGSTPAQIDKVYIAGGFGNKLNIENAITIGIIPKEFQGKVELVGNSSLGGAVKYLLDSNGEKELSKIIKNTEYIELSNSVKFNEYYINYMMFE